MWFLSLYGISVLIINVYNDGSLYLHYNNDLFLLYLFEMALIEAKEIILLKHGSYGIKMSKEIEDAIIYRFTRCIY